MSKLLGAICICENVCFPASITWDGADVPIVLSTRALTPGDYLLVTLDTAGDVEHAVPFTMEPTFDSVERTDIQSVGTHPEYEPTLRLVLRNVGVSSIPKYLDAKTLRLVGLRLHSDTGVVYHALKDVPQNAIRLQHTGNDYTLEPGETVTTTDGLRVALNVKLTVSPDGLIVNTQFPLAVDAMVFTAGVLYTPLNVPFELPADMHVTGLNLDTGELLPLDSVVTYDGLDHTVVTTLAASTPVLCVGFCINGHTGAYEPEFGMFTRGAGDMIILRLDAFGTFTVKEVKCQTNDQSVES